MTSCNIKAICNELKQKSIIPRLPIDAFSEAVSIGGGLGGVTEGNQCKLPEFLCLKSSDAIDGGRFGSF